MLSPKPAHPTRYDYEAYKEWRDADDARQKEALKRFYARNAAPHYSRPFPRWKLALIGIFIGSAGAALGTWWLITQALDRFQP